MQALPAGDQTEGNTLRALFSEIRKEETKPHIDLEKSLTVRLTRLVMMLVIGCMHLWQEITLAALLSSLFPTSAATDKLALLKSRAQKAQGGQPFPLMDIEEFLPTWAKEVRALPRGRCARIAPVCLFACCTDTNGRQHGSVFRSQL